MQPDHSAPTDHRAQFDMLRGLAALAVVLAHTQQILIQRLLGSDHAAVLFSSTIARHAVLVFFLLSGYLITQSIVGNVRRHGRLDAGEYLSSRIARIYPPLVGAILVVVAAGAIIQGFALPGATRYGLPSDLYVVRNAFTVTGKDVADALLMRSTGMLDADGPLWTLYIEVRLYLIAMFLAMAGRGWRLLWAGVAVALMAHWTHAGASFAFFAAVWALGASMALGFFTARWPAILFGSALLAAGLFFPRSLYYDDPNPWVSYGMQFAACVVYATLIFRSRLPSPSPLVRTGVFSYSLYLIHWPLLLLAYSLAQNWMGHSLARSVATGAGADIVIVLFAAAFAKLFEDQARFKPSIRFVLRKLLMSKQVAAAR